MSINKVAVLGSGVMGSGIAGMLAKNGFKVILLDRKSPSDKNIIVNEAINKLLSHPSNIAARDQLQQIKIGNFEDDLKLLEDCDWVIEVVIEKLEIKQQLYQKIIPYIKSTAILSSNTSTLPLKALRTNLPDPIQKNFFITHFFNPVEQLKLTEVVSMPDSEPVLLHDINQLLIGRLNKTPTQCYDTPGFIANRIGCFLLEMVARKALNEHQDITSIDQIFSELFKLPKTGIFGLYDLIGHDVMKLISESLLQGLPNGDLYHQIYISSPRLEQMHAKGYLGNKNNLGFYKTIIDNFGQKTRQLIDFQDFTYKSHEKSELKFDNINQFLQAKTSSSLFFQEILCKFYCYIFSLVPNVARSSEDIDHVLKLGYGWKYGPFEMLDKFDINILITFAHENNIAIPPLMLQRVAN